jgi:hypothetical protein
MIYRVCVGICDEAKNKLKLKLESSFRVTPHRRRRQRRNRDGARSRTSRSSSRLGNQSELGQGSLSEGEGSVRLSSFS